MVKATHNPLLLVLDLNGTLLYRKKNKQGRAVPGGKVTTRPYLGCLLRYCLGPYYDMNQKKLMKKWPLAKRHFLRCYAHGSDLWAKPGGLISSRTKVYPPPTPIFLSIWSSARHDNVLRMINTMTHTDVQRALFQCVWTRDTLVTRRDFNNKVGTTKDLSILWDELNRWAQYLQTRSSSKEKPKFLSRASANSRYYRFRSKMRRMNADGIKVNPKMRDEDTLFMEFTARTSGSLDSLYGPLISTPFGPQNTILLDDSASKARCQPFNHVCIPEYGKEKAEVYSAYLENGEPEAMLPQLDNFLLQFVGVLDTIQDVPNVAEWIEGGGVATFSEDQTPEDRAKWEKRGRDALERHGIPIRP